MKFLFADFRVVSVPASDLSNSENLRIELEAWLPSISNYITVSIPRYLLNII